MLEIIKRSKLNILTGLKKNGMLELMRVLLLVFYKQQKNDLIQKLLIQIQNTINQLLIQNLSLLLRNSF